MRISKDDMHKAAAIGADVVKNLVQLFGRERHKLNNRFMTLSIALNKSNPQLRLDLIAGKIKVKDFVVMQEKDLANDAAKKERAELMEYNLQARRTDAVLDHQLKNNLVESIYTCIKCKGNKVTMYTQQTRSADEPMTEFYNCMDCFRQWKR